LQLGDVLAADTVIDKCLACIAASDKEQVATRVIFQSNRTMSLLSRDQDLAFTCLHITTIDCTRGHRPNKELSPLSGGDAFRLETIRQRDNRLEARAGVCDNHCYNNSRYNRKGDN